MTEIDKAWMAGLFEGEGCITGQLHHGKHYYPRLQIKMTDFDVIKRFADLADCGKLTQEKVYQPHHKPTLKWTCTRRLDVYRILETLLPYLGERRSFRALHMLDVIDRC